MQGQKASGFRIQEIFQKLRDTITGPYLLIMFLVVVGLLSSLIPVSDTLWAKILSISGTVNIADYTPTPTGDGCPPEFWGQPQHFGYWPPLFAPDDPFETVFFGREGGAPPTLLQVLKLEGDGFYALMRHSVAAILNASSPDVDYGYLSDEVIRMFNEAVEYTDSSAIETVKRLFETVNRSDCPLPPLEPLGTPTPSETPQPTETPTPTEITDTPTRTSTPILNNITSTPSTTPSDTPTPTETSTPTPLPTDTPTPTQTPSPTPFEEGEGCAVGFWVEPENFDSWPDPYTTETSFESIFERDVPDDPTLLQALEDEGEDLGPLMRQTVAALLNAESPEVEYVIDLDEIIRLFQEAFDSDDPALIEATMELFKAANTLDCPLPLPTPTATPTSTPTSTDTQVPTATGTPTPVDTATPTPTATGSPTPIDTTTPTSTDTPTPVDTLTYTPTATPVE
jgi:hypothetical protein